MMPSSTMAAMMRRSLQPIAIMMPVSRVRSCTAISSTLSTLRPAVVSAMIEIASDTALQHLDVAVVGKSWSVGSTLSGAERLDLLLDRRRAVGADARLKRDMEDGDLVGAERQLLQVLQPEHDDAAVDRRLVAGDADDLEAVVEHRDLVADALCRAPWRRFRRSARRSARPCPASGPRRAASPARNSWSSAMPTVRNWNSPSTGANITSSPATPLTPGIAAIVGSRFAATKPEKRSEASRCETVRSAPRSRALSSVDRSMLRDSASSATAVAMASAMPSTSSSVRVGRRSEVAVGKQRQASSRRLACDHSVVGDPAVLDVDAGGRPARRAPRHA